MIMSLALIFGLFTNSKNFGDMKAVVDLIFKDHDPEKEIELSDIFNVGSFDDGSEFEAQVHQPEQETWNGHVITHEFA